MCSVSQVWRQRGRIQLLFRQHILRGNDGQIVQPSVRKAPSFRARINSTDCVAILFLT